MANNEYILFLDETDTNTDNKYFCLAGFFISRKRYENSLIPKINQLKIDTLSDPHIVFHFRNMRQQTDNFTILHDYSIRTHFWQQLGNVLQKEEMYTIGAYIDAIQYRKNYPNKLCVSEYNVLFNEIINSFVYFLTKHNGIGSIMIESRTSGQNKATRDLYVNMLKNGTNYFNAYTIKKRIATMNFNIKKDNSIGLQVADMIPSIFVRGINLSDNRYNMNAILSTKLYDGGCGNVDGYGLIKVLK